MRLALALAGALALVSVTPAAAHVGRGPHRHVVVPARPVVASVRPALRPVVVARPPLMVPVRPVAPLRRPALSVRIRF